MMNRPIEGVVIATSRKGTALGQSRFDGVTLRRSDGIEQHLGSVTVATRLADALQPGTAGLFYFHDIMGSQGLHGFQAPGEPVRLAFPTLVERAFAFLAVLNLGLVGLWIGMDGGLQLVPLMLGVLATTAWATCRGGREAVLHDFRYENQVAAARSHRRAVLGRCS